MDIEKAVDQSHKISQDLASHCKDPNKCAELINGTGFKEQYVGSDFLAIQLDKANLANFLNDYLPSMSSLPPKIKSQLDIFCKNLHLIIEMKWHKFETLFDCN
jgi:hypothetical protein